MIQFKIDFIPPEVFEMTDITSLWLCHNKITVVPSSIGDLKRLEVLSLQSNLLTNIPPEVCLLERLTTIHLQGNQLRTVPNLLGRLKNLTDLDLSNNMFEDFPAVLTTLPRLTVLHMRNNKLTTLPSGMTNLRTMVILDVQGNLITEPPYVLLKMPWCQVHGCPIPVSFGDSSALSFHISGYEVEELKELLMSRSQAAIANKSRRRKKKSGYDLSPN